MLKTPKHIKSRPHVAQRHSIVQEKRVADSIGGQTIKGSGRGVIKGDSRKKGFVRVENKCTANKSFSVNKEMIEKIESAALLAGEIPVIQVDLLTKQGSIDCSFLLLPTHALASILELREESII